MISYTPRPSHAAYNFMYICICHFICSVQKNPAHYGLDQANHTTATATGADTEEAASTRHFDTLLEGLCIK